MQQPRARCTLCRVNRPAKQCLALPRTSWDLYTYIYIYIYINVYIGYIYIYIYPYVIQCINCAQATRYAGPTASQHNHPPAHPAAVAVGQTFALLSGLPARSPKHHTTWLHAIVFVGGLVRVWDVSLHGSSGYTLCLNFQFLGTGIPATRSRPSNRLASSSAQLLTTQT